MTRAARQLADGGPVRGLRRRRRGVRGGDARPAPARSTAEEPLTTKEGWRRFADRQTAMPRAARPGGAGSDDGAGAGRARRGPAGLSR